MFLPARSPILSPASNPRDIFELQLRRRSSDPCRRVVVPAPLAPCVDTAKVVGSFGDAMHLGQAPAAPSGRADHGAPATRALTSVRCKHCSLLVFEGPAYYDVWHGIVSHRGGVPASQGAGCGDAGSGSCEDVGDSGRPGNEGRRGGGGMGVGGDGDGEQGRSRGERIAGNAAGEASAADVESTIPCGQRVGGRRHEMRGVRDKRVSFTVRRVSRVVPAESVVEHPEARSERERRRRSFERSVTETGAGSGRSG